MMRSSSGAPRLYPARNIIWSVLSHPTVHSPPPFRTLRSFAQIRRWRHAKRCRRNCSAVSSRCMHPVGSRLVTGGDRLPYAAQARDLSTRTGTEHVNTQGDEAGIRRCGETHGWGVAVALGAAVAAGGLRTALLALRIVELLLRDLASLHVGRNLGALGRVHRSRAVVEHRHCLDHRATKRRQACAAAARAR